MSSSFHSVLNLFFKKIIPWNNLKGYMGSNLYIYKNIYFLNSKLLLNSNTCNTPVVFICCSTSVSTITKVSFWCLILTFLRTGAGGFMVGSCCLSGIGVSPVLGEGTAGGVLTLACWTIPCSEMLSKYPTTGRELESPHWCFPVLSSKTKPL